MKGQNGQSKKSSCIPICLLSFCFVFLLMFLLFLLKGFAPFGDNSLAAMDASYQYLDFFSYLKDVFDGENSIGYTFSKDLGGTGIGLFSYYLASPFNLLLLFFRKENIVIFFDLAVVLKLSTAALTAAYFLQKRFLHNLRPCFVLLLSISYALMQYSLFQSSNIMWLDGVYMLPLMLLGVYYIVNRRKPLFLIFTTGAAILFNWYTAGINCLFTGIWFCLEWLLATETPFKFSKSFVKDTLKIILLYIGSMLTGVLLSSVLFLPTIITLRTGGEGIFDWSVFNASIAGNPLHVLKNFMLGSSSAKGSPSLFCGTFAVLGCFGFFLSSQKPMSVKIKAGVVMLLCFLTLYWQPFITIFSLLKDVASYWYRYSYTTIFLMIFIAADYYSGVDKENHVGISMFLYAFLYSAMIIFATMIKAGERLNMALFSCILIFSVTLVTVSYIKSLTYSGTLKTITTVSLTAMLAVELSCNASLFMDDYSKENASSYYDYSLAQQEQIKQIKEIDPEPYRIAQTRSWNISSSFSMRANYDEALAYNYWSTGSYTSDAANDQLAFLEKIGYRSERIIPIINQSILAADSFIGVRYILSEYPFNGLELLESQGAYNTKQVYLNPFALPMALVYSSDINKAAYSQELNPFEYQNLLYSRLMGENVELYTPLDYEITDITETSRTYNISIPKGEYAIYGNIPWDEYMNANLDVNGAYKMGYSRWTSPSVFYIPVEYGDPSAQIVITFGNDTVQDEQFYALDLTLLKEVSAILQAKAPEIMNIQNGSAQFEVTADKSDESLFVSIPVSNGWTIKLNGEKIEPFVFSDIFYSIPLIEGKNLIEMSYSVPGLIPGLLISVFTLCILLGYILSTRFYFKTSLNPRKV